MSADCERILNSSYVSESHERVCAESVIMSKCGLAFTDTNNLSVVGAQLC